MNQEIYDDLGQMGSLMLLGVLVASVDGEIDDSELDTLTSTFVRFANEEAQTAEYYGDLLNRVVQAFKRLDTIENQVNYAVLVCNTLKRDLSETMCRELYGEFSKMAMADGELHENEATLLDIYKDHLL